MQLPHLGRCESHRTLRSEQGSAYQVSLRQSISFVLTSAGPAPFHPHGKVVMGQTRVLLQMVEAAALLFHSWVEAALSLRRAASLL